MTPPPLWETGSDQLSYLAHLASRLGGFELEKERSLLSDPRVMDLLFREKVGTLEELVSRLRALPEGALHQNVVESLAVADTSFFRDSRVFHAIEKDLLPWLLDRPSRDRRLTLWSAGCSTGQEAYSLAMAAEEALESALRWSFQVVGTDLSTRNIRTAEMGVYSQFDINCGLPAPKLVRYFEKKEGQWRIRESLKKMVSFKKLNLTDPALSYPSVDCILLRNVLVYFDAKHRRAVLARIRECLRPDGFLILGDGESLSTTEGFEPLHHGRVTVYRPTGTAASPPDHFSLAA